MTLWSHLPTIFKRRYALQTAMILALCVGIITTLFFGVITRAQEGINQTISFQGRLLDGNGNVVPDGHYNMQFNIYEGGSGTAAGNPDGSLVWTETYINNGGTNGVEVKNGYLSVNLGSKEAFGNQVDWNDDTLWLSMNIAGSATDCTSFDSGTCDADGEMLPMKRLTTSPYAMNSGKLGGKSADEFLQLGAGAQVDAGVDTSSIFINKTSSGNLIRLQNNANDVLTVADSGDITFGSTGDKTISVAGAGADTAGNSLTISGGNGGSGTGSDGGNVIIKGGDAGGTNANGGDIVLSGGAGNGTGANGLVVINTPTFSTVINDANCYTNGAVVAASCSIAASSVNNNAGVMVGFSVADQTATLPDPIIKTAGRVIYVMAASDSETFTVSINGGGVGNEVRLKPNTTATMVWNGSDWTASGATTSRPVDYSADGMQIQVGDGVDAGDPTVLTLDKAAAAPVVVDQEAMLGSMYYDTTLGKVQCYEADGWGSCSASPDNFVTLSPEYTNAVANGTGIGTLTSDICSDALNINDDTTPTTVCDANETYNFYDWTSVEATAQTRSIYVTYQLPANFTGFVAGSTSLMGRVSNGSNASVAYQVYKNTPTGLASCGTLQSVLAASSWEKVTASGAADPKNCSFAPGDSLMIKIELTASNGAHAYVSTLGFAFSDD